MLRSIGMLAVLLAGGWGIFALYVHHRVAQELAAAPISIAYGELTTWWPGRITLRDVTLSNTPADSSEQQASDEAWSLSLERAELSYTPVHAPRSLHVRVPPQSATLETQLAQGQLEVQAEAWLDELQPARLASVDLSAQATSLSVAEQQAPALTARVELRDVSHTSSNVATADTAVSRAPQLQGSLELTGQNAHPLFSALHADTALQWMFPKALDAPFALHAALSVSDHAEMGPSR